MGGVSWDQVIPSLPFEELPHSPQQLASFTVREMRVLSFLHPHQNYFPFFVSYRCPDDVEWGSHCSLVCISPIINAQTFILCFLKWGLCVALAVLELVLWTRLASDSGDLSGFASQSAEIKGTCPHCPAQNFILENIFSWAVVAHTYNSSIW